MRYLIIGLGIYGTNLARDLTDLGHEVIGADIKNSAIEPLKDYIATVYLIDSTDETQIDVLPLRNVDLVIVTIGENFGASVKTVALLKRFGVEHIYARAIDPLHHSILECFNLDRILIPEQRAAHDLSLEMLLGSDVITIPIAGDILIATFTVPAYFIGTEYARLNLQAYEIRLVAAARPKEHKNLIGVSTNELEALDLNTPGLTVTAGDRLTCLATRKAYKNLISKIS